MYGHELLVAEARNCTSSALEAWIWSLTVSLDETDDPETRGFILVRLEVLKAEVAKRERIADPMRALRRTSSSFDLERIKADVSLLDALPAMAAVELTKRGSIWVGACPFPDHHDGTPSFVVKGDGRLWHCKGCLRGGDIFTFAEEWYATRAFRHAVELVLSVMQLPVARYQDQTPPAVLRQGQVRVG